MSLSSIIRLVVEFLFKNFLLTNKTKQNKKQFVLENNRITMEIAVCRTEQQRLSKFGRRRRRSRPSESFQVCN